MKLEIGQLILWDNRFGVITEIFNTHVKCEGFPNFLRLTDFFVEMREFHAGRVLTDIQTTSVYEFQEAIGENIYDPRGYAEGYRVLEAAKNMSGRYDGEDRPEYWVKMFNPATKQLRMLATYRSAVDGILRWTHM